MNASIYESPPWKMAERITHSLFGRLGVGTCATPTTLQDESSIRVIYPKRFGDKQFIIAVLIPATERIVLLHEFLLRNDCSAFAAWINRSQGTYLRIAWHMGEVSALVGEKYLLLFACRFASWIGRQFPDRAVVVSPMSGVIEMRLALQMCR